MSNALRLPSASRPHTPINPDFSQFPRGNVRRRGRERWQARVYVGGRAGGAVHLGMYASYEAAAQVAKKLLRTLLITMFSSDDGDARHLTPLHVWHAAQKLARSGWDVDSQLASLLPRCVKPDGRGGYGYRLKGGNGDGGECGGYESPEDAYKAAVAARKRLARVHESPSSDPACGQDF
jgi:hypothetical protein